MNPMRLPARGLGVERDDFDQGSPALAMMKATPWRPFG
jgi:hypothetical protein